MPGPGRGWREASISISSSSSNDHENSNDNGAAQLGQLDVLRDFDAVQTLSSQPHIGASVKIVTCKPRLGKTRRVFAVKTIDKLYAAKLHGQTTISVERDLLVAALRQGRNDVVKLVAATQSQQRQRQRHDLNLILEYLPAGDLGLLLEDRGSLDKAIVKHLAAQTFEALFWLHGQHYVHRDVKPSNILLTLDGRVQLTDFGSAAPLQRHEDGRLLAIRSFCSCPVGTVDYIAPEILSAHEASVEHQAEADSDDEGEGDDLTDSTKEQSGGLQSPGPYGFLVDYWSLGVSIFEMLSGELPFYADTVPETYERIINIISPAFSATTHWSDESRILIQGLLRASSVRLGKSSVSEIRKHPFFTGIDWARPYGGCPPLRLPLRPLRPDVGMQQSGQPDQPGTAAAASLSINHTRSYSRGFDFSALFDSPSLSILRPTPLSRRKKKNNNASSFNGFDYDLSVLDADRWASFDFSPAEDAFVARADEVTLDRLLASPGGIVKEHGRISQEGQSVVEPQQRNFNTHQPGDIVQQVTHDTRNEYPCTPARRSVSPFLGQATDTRTRNTAGKQQQPASSSGAARAAIIGTSSSSGRRAGEDNAAAALQEAIDYGILKTVRRTSARKSLASKSLGELLGTGTNLAESKRVLFKDVPSLLVQAHSEHEKQAPHPGIAGPPPASRRNVTTTTTAITGNATSAKMISGGMPSRAQEPEKSRHYGRADFGKGAADDGEQEQVYENDAVVSSREHRGTTKSASSASSSSLKSERIDEFESRHAKLVRDIHDIQQRYDELLRKSSTPAAARRESAPA